MLKAIWLRVQILFWLAVAMIVIHGINEALNFHFLIYGIYPGNEATLLHVFSAPFLHGSIPHLMNNLVGFAIFGWLCLMRGIAAFILASLVIIVISGLMIWLFGRPAWHIGASGWIFGLWSLSIAMAWFDRRLLNILLAIGVVFLYGGMIYGVLPEDPRVSWEAHLFGAIAGVLAAWLVALLNTAKKRRIKRKGSRFLE